MQNNIKRDLKYVRQNINEINDKIEKILSITDIVNNMDTGGINKVLSAEVGKQLKLQLENSRSECTEFKRRLAEALANKGNVVNPAGSKDEFLSGIYKVGGGVTLKHRPLIFEVTTTTANTSFGFPGIGTYYIDIDWGGWDIYSNNKWTMQKFLL